MVSIRRIASRKIEADVLVVGGGLAGLIAAIRASEFVPRVTLVDKAKISRSGCSPFAAGIYNAVLDGDDHDRWIKEVIEAGDYLNDQHWVKLHAELSSSIVVLLNQWSQQYSLPIFEKDETGQLIRKKSRGHIHSSHLVVNSLPMMEVLRRKALEKGVKFLERTAVTGLITRDGKVEGAIGFGCRTGQINLFLAPALVLAAGGCGFKSIFVGHKNLTGDLQAAALRAGAVFKNMEQCESNTCYKGFDIHGMNLMINVGGKFLNARGQEFMWKYNPTLGNRALLSELALSFCQEVRAGRGPIYLDVTAASREDRKLCRKILPQSFQAWDRAGIDPFSQKLEWVPAFYGTIAVSGGLDIDRAGKTSLANLFAAGDMTYVPSGGSGLGGIPLSFASISGYRAGESAGKFAAGSSKKEVPAKWEEAVSEAVSPILRTNGVSPDALIYDLQKLLFSYPVCYIKSKERLTHALSSLEELKARAACLWAPNLHELVKANEATNMLAIAEAFLRASLFREESRGFHFREDFPRTDNKNWLKWVLLRQENNKYNLWAEEIPTPCLRPKEDYLRARGTIFQEI